MIREIEVKEIALTRLLKAVSWYDDQKEGLGLSFLEEWEAVLDYISAHAEGCQIRYKSFRQAMFKRFPYLVIYEIEGNKVVVYNVINTSRSIKKRYKKK